MDAEQPRISLHDARSHDLPSLRSPHAGSSSIYAAPSEGRGRLCIRRCVSIDSSPRRRATCVLAMDRPFVIGGASHIHPSANLPPSGGGGNPDSHTATANLAHSIIEVRSSTAAGQTAVDRWTACVGLRRIKPHRVGRAGSAYISVLCTATNRVAAADLREGRRVHRACKIVSIQPGAREASLGSVGDCFEFTANRLAATLKLRRNGPRRQERRGGVMGSSFAADPCVGVDGCALGSSHASSRRTGLLKISAWNQHCIREEWTSSGDKKGNTAAHARPE